MSNSSSNNSSPNMTDSEYAKCHAIIHSAALAAGGVGAGLAQIPLSDNLVIMPIQIGMVGSLGSVFDKSLGEAAITSLISAAAATVVGRNLAGALVGWIPGIGNVIQASTAFTLTETIGWIIANNFAIEKRNAEKEVDRLEEMRIRLEEMEEEAERSRLEEKESVPALAANIFTRIITTVKIFVLWVCSSVVKAVRFVLNLPKSALHSVVDMLRSVGALLVWVKNLFIHPIQAILRAVVNVGRWLKALGVIAWKAIQFLGPILLGFKVTLFVMLKINIFPALHPYLTFLYELIDLIQ